VHYVFPFPI